MGKPGRPRKQGPYFRYRPGCRIIQVEYRMPDGNTIPESSGCDKMAAAREKAKARYQELLADFYTKNPDLKKEVVAAPEKPDKPLSFGRTIKGKMQKRYDDYIAEHRCRNTRNYYQGIKNFWKFLGDRANHAWGTLTREDFVRYRHYVLDSPTVKKSKDRYLQDLRIVTRGLFPDEFLNELKLTRADRSQSESAGGPLWQEHIRLLLLQEPKEQSLVRGIFWLILSGGMQIVDCALMLRAEIEKQLAVLNRRKTDEGACFPLLPPFIEWYRTRQYREGEVYVFPELFFDKKDERLPSYNQKEVHFKTQYEREKVSGQAADILMEFVRRAGVNDPSISSKSFRQHNATLFAVLGVPYKISMQIFGQKKLASYLRYVRPSDLEIRGVSTLFMDYLNATRDGKPFFAPASTYEMYKAIVEKWDSFPAIIKALLNEEFGGRIENLYLRLFEQFARVHDHLERTNENLSAQIGSLEQRLLTQQVASQSAIESTIGRMENRLVGLLEKNDLPTLCRGTTGLLPSGDDMWRFDL